MTIVLYLRMNLSQSHKKARFSFQYLIRILQLMVSLFQVFPKLKPIVSSVQQVYQLLSPCGMPVLSPEPQVRGSPFLLERGCRTGLSQLTSQHVAASLSLLFSCCSNKKPTGSCTLVLPITCQLLRLTSKNCYPSLLTWCGYKALLVVFPSKTLFEKTQIKNTDRSWHAQFL